MSSTALPPVSDVQPSPSPWKVLSIIAGSLLALVAAALVLSGAGLLIAHGVARDDDGFFRSPTERVSTPTAALTSEGIDLGDLEGGGDWVLEELAARARVQATPTGDQELFVGIARESDVDAYLAGTAHDEITDVHDGDVTYRRSGGTAAAAAPERQDFWVVSTAGPGPRQLDWDPEGGRWAAVVMNADGSPGVVADVRVGVRIGSLVGIAVAFIAAGLILLAVAGTLIWLGVRRGHTTIGPGAPVNVAAVPIVGDPRVAGMHPVDVQARLDEPLSRWLWIVKWFLAIPHYIVLAFLWLAFVGLTVIAFFAILFTGRYPRGIFDFNVGVLRWSWRVAYYSTGALATDRYPPFSLAPADYPAELTVPYPKRLSRGKAVVKWWLLAIPHYAILAAFYGAWNVVWTVGDTQLQPPGLLGVLIIIAAVVLLVTGRYPRDVFRLVVGIHRWALRVAAYAALMRDEYPPFRFEDAPTASPSDRATGR